MENLITCMICGKQSSRIYGKHLKSHNITSEEYKKMFPGKLLCSELDSKETSKNSGQHMKQDKYRKMFSEKIKGENNPNSKSKTTEYQRKERSPFSEKFSNYSNDEERINFSERVKNNRTPKSYNTKIEYWIALGYNAEESKSKLIERQKTFTIEKCIEKYGEERGTKIWGERQEKWSEKIEDKYKNGDFLKLNNNMYSKPELEIFNIISEKLNIEKESYFGKKQFFRKSKEIGRAFSYDFVYKNKVIEFNGDFWHCNPKIYNKNYFHKFFQMSAEEIWKRDDIKIKFIEKEGYEVLIIWENDYRKSPEETISKCLEFLLR